LKFPNELFEKAKGAAGVSARLRGIPQTYAETSDTQYGAGGLADDGI